MSWNLHSFIYRGICKLCVPVIMMLGKLLMNIVHIRILRGSSIDPIFMPCDIHSLVWESYVPPVYYLLVISLVN